MTSKAEMRDQPKRHSAAQAALALSGAVNTSRSVAAWFRPRGALGLSGLFSPLGIVAVDVHAPRTRPVRLPALLRSTDVTPLHRYYEGSDSYAGLAPTQVSLLHAHHHRQRSVPNHPARPCRRFHTLPSARQVSGGGREDSRRRAARPSLHAGFRLRHSLAGSPATPGRIGFVILRTTNTPNRCSPPRLAAAQLRPASGLSVNQEGTYTPRIVCARRRTSAAFPAAKKGSKMLGPP